MSDDDFRTWKITSAVSLLFLTFFSSYVPWVIKKRFKASSLVMSYLNCAAGGVVLGALMMHMLPHVIESEDDDNKVYPYGALCAGLAFLLLFAIDRLFLTHSHLPNTPLSVEKSCHSNDLMGGCHTDAISPSSSKAQAFVFVLALSVHSFFEGLGMATQQTEKNIVSYIISLFTHKWLEAFAMGVTIMNAYFSHTVSFLLILFYSSLTPLGKIAWII